MITTRLHGMYKAMGENVGVIHLRTLLTHSTWIATLCAEDPSDLSKAKLIKNLIVYLHI